MKYEYIKEIDINLPIAENYKDVWTFIQSDFFRVKRKKVSIFDVFIDMFVGEPTLSFQFWLRLASYKRKNIIWIIAKIMHRRKMFKYGLLIPSSTRIGFGLFIGHPLSIVVNHSAIIGNNVNLSHFTTIGANEIHAAYIGDNVYIGPSVSIIEDVCIGSNCTIGSGSIVTKSINANSTAVGNAARVIKENTLPRYINNPWIFNVNKI